MDKQQYIYNQTVEGLSHEEDMEIWRNGQIRFLEFIADKLKPNSTILDCGCGDGVGLVKLNDMGHNPRGIDLSPDKVERARAKGFIVLECEMENLLFADETFDCVISSHSLEHARDPMQTLSELKRVLKLDGQVFVVLPFPDPGDWNRHIHTAKGILRTDQEDPSMVVAFFESQGFNVESFSFDSYREPEIWLHLRPGNNDDF